MPPRRVRARDDDEEDDAPVSSSSRDVGSSSSSSRLSGAHAQADQKKVGETIKSAMLSLSDLANRIKTNKEGVSDDVLTGWKDRVVELAKEAARILKSDEVYERRANETIQEKFRNIDNVEAVNLEELDMDEIQKKIEDKVATDMKTFKAEDDPKVKEITNVCTNKADEEDEDLVALQDSDIREADLKCPYTQMPMSRPMKNINPNKPCIHHISPEALDAITKGKAGQGGTCPVAGCPGKWLKSHAIEDEDHKRMIDRYLRKKRARTEASEFTQAMSDAVDLE